VDWLSHCTQFDPDWQTLWPLHWMTVTSQFTVAVQVARAWRAAKTQAVKTERITSALFIGSSLR
jgi:hypothetical protein